jgi:hypothetical protein
MCYCQVHVSLSASLNHRLLASLLIQCMLNSICWRQCLFAQHGEMLPPLRFCSLMNTNVLNRLYSRLLICQSNQLRLQLSSSWSKLVRQSKLSHTYPCSFKSSSELLGSMLEASKTSYQVSFLTKLSPFGFPSCFTTSFSD